MIRVSVRACTGLIDSPYRLSCPRVGSLHSWLMSPCLMSHVGRLTGAAGPLLAASAVSSAAAVQALAAPNIPLSSRPFAAKTKYASPEALVGAQVSDIRLLSRCTP